jgi:hypothetical protein
MRVEPGQAPAARQQYAKIQELDDEEKLRCAQSVLDGPEEFMRQYWITRMRAEA